MVSLAEIVAMFTGTCALADRNGFVLQLVQLTDSYLPLNIESTDFTNTKKKGVADHSATPVRLIQFP
jgi:hypothetical protein